MDSQWNRWEEKAGSAETVAMIREVVGNPSAWMFAKNPAFRGSRPVDLLGTERESEIHAMYYALVSGCF